MGMSVRHTYKKDKGEKYEGDKGPLPTSGSAGGASYRGEVSRWKCTQTESELDPQQPRGRGLTLSP